MKTEDEIKRLKQLILENNIGKAESNWEGTGVIIDNKPRSPDPSDKFVITEFSLEISWLFNCLGDVFFKDNLIDYCSKYEFFERLADSANDKLNNCNNISKQDLCMSVLNEAEKICSEIKNGTV